MSLRIGVLCFTSLLYSGLMQANDIPMDTMKDNMPTIERTEVDLPKLDRRDLALGIWTGLMSIEDFGVNAIVGARIGYQVSESVFFESRYAQTKADKTSFETISNVQLLTDENRQLKFYDLGVGYRINGQSFVTRRRSLTSNIYVVGSMGNTQFADSDAVTFTLGAGFNLLMNRWLMITLEVRDHVWDSEVLGTAKITHNLVSGVGVSTFF